MDLDNELAVCPHTSDPHSYPCFTRGCRAHGNTEVGAAGNPVDRTYEATCTVFHDLLLRKQGDAFERLTVHVAGHCDEACAEVLSAEGPRQYLGGSAQERTFVYEPREEVDGRSLVSFEKQLVRETTAKRVEIVSRRLRGLLPD